MIPNLNTPEGALYGLCKELLDSGFIPEEFEDEVRDAITRMEIED